jgi:hypothetical protein
MRIRVDPASSIHDNTEIFHITHRRHSSLKMFTPAGHERLAHSFHEPRLEVSDLTG